MKLRRVVRDLESTTLKAVVLTEEGSLIEIEINWAAKGGLQAGVTDAWYETLKAETQEARRKAAGHLDLYDIAE